MDDFEWQIGHPLLNYRNYPCQNSDLTFWNVSTSTINRFDPSTGRFSKTILSFLTQNEATCRYVSIAPMQSNMLNLIKISKSGSEVIQRTLRSGENWPRYSSFSAISQVKWPNLHAWRPSNPHWKNKTRCPKKLKHRNQKRHDLQRMHIAKVLYSYLQNKFDFFRNMPEKSPQYCQFTRQNALFDKTLSLLSSQFLVDPLPVLVSP